MQAGSIASSSLEAVSHIFRVNVPVTRRTPHSAGGESFPHPVPRF